MINQQKEKKQSTYFLLIKNRKEISILFFNQEINSKYNLSKINDVSKWEPLTTCYQKFVVKFLQKYCAHNTTLYIIKNFSFNIFYIKYLCTYLEVVKNIGGSGL